MYPFNTFTNAGNTNTFFFKRHLASIVFLLALLAPGASFAKTFYLDSQLSQNCTSGDYSIADRGCSGSDGDAYNNIQDAIDNLSGGDTLYVRSGVYTRTTGQDYIGALEIDAAGTATNHTVVSAYGDEEPIIGTDPNKLQYNPDPGSHSTSSSSHYYPNPAISIHASYVDLMGFKTYGQLLVLSLSGSDIYGITVQNNDFGGGGPFINQGQVVMLHDVHDVTVKNNKVHNSCWGESDINGAALMGYNFSATIENNEFYDNWGPDVRMKDTGGQSGRATRVRYNFFRPSSYRDNVGYKGINQDADIENIYIHNNIFLNKTKGIDWHGTGYGETVAYNNTFINCDQDIYTWLDDVKINAFNNLSYHSTSDQNFYNIQASPLDSELDSNYNLFYSANGSTTWRNLYSTVAGSFSEWKSHSGEDSASVAKDPGFVNSGGNRPEDFKRTSYSGDVNGSPYGSVVGAYITGNETIGLLDSFSGTSDTVPPAPPALQTIQ